MNNRLAVYTRGLVEAIFADGRYLYVKEREWDRDRSRLLKQLEARNIGVLTLELPALSKHFRRCLDEGRFTRSDGVLSRPAHKGEEIPLFLREIFLRIFDPKGEVLANPCVDAVHFIETIYGTFKSIRLDCPQGKVDEEVKNFFRLDASLPNPSLNWDLDDLGADDSEESHWMARSLHVRDFGPSRYRLSAGALFDEGDSGLPDEWYATIQGCFDIVATEFGLAPHLRGGESDTYFKPRHGPGAVAEMSKKDSKYRFRNWPSKLQRLFPRDEYALPGFGRGFSCDRGTASGHEDTWYNHEPLARLIAVPKTMDKPRLIAAEPASHQWIQQFLLQELVSLTGRSDILSRVIDFKSQVPNQIMALKGSEGGHFATVDLSEASDRLTCKLVERFFRANHGWLESFHACRTRAVSYMGPNFCESARLRKFACMGSALTFPVQSMVYATIGLAAIAISKNCTKLSKRKLRDWSSKVRVFGDDIVIERSSLGIFQKILSNLCFKVNTSKTFSGNNFRESCGVSAFRGYNVTPPRVKEIPDGNLNRVASLVETSNNFHKHGFWITARYILDQVEKVAHRLPIDRAALYPCTVFSFVGKRTDHLKRRWNADLQRDEIFVLTTRVKSTVGRMHASERIMQYFTEDPSPETKWASGYSPSRTVVSRPGWVPLQ